MTEKFVREQLMNARKSRDKVLESVYGNLLNKVMVAEKSGRYTLPLSEDVVNEMATREVKEIEETLSFYKEPCEKSKELETQISELKKYLPTNMTEEEVIAIIKELSATETNIGKLTGMVCKAVGSRFDRSKVNGLVRSALSFRYGT